MEDRGLPVSVWVNKSHMSTCETESATMTKRFDLM